MDVVRLPDGRELEVEVSGPEDGPVLLWHAGTPGTARQPRFLSRAVHARGWRLVTTSRPGYAGSTRAPGRTVADVVPDAEAVLDRLAVDAAYVGGASGGGPHTLACAARLGGRVRAALSVCSVAPWDAEGLDPLAGMGEDNLEELGAAVQGEQPLRAFLEQALPQLATADAEQMIEVMASLLPDVDRACLSGEVGEDFAAGMRRVGAGGVDGWLDDDLAFVRPWGFALSEIAVPVALWQGSADLMVPFAHGQWLAGQVPGVRAHLEPGQGHLSISVGSIDRMLAELEELGDGAGS